MGALLAGGPEHSSVNPPWPRDPTTNRSRSETAPTRTSAAPPSTTRQSISTPSASASISAKALVEQPLAGSSKFAHAGVCEDAARPAHVAVAAARDASEPEAPGVDDAQLRLPQARLGDRAAKGLTGALRAVHANSHDGQLLQSIVRVHARSFVSRPGSTDALVPLWAIRRSSALGRPRRRTWASTTASLCSRSRAA